MICTGAVRLSHCREGLSAASGHAHLLSLLAEAVTFSGAEAQERREPQEREQRVKRQGIKSKLHGQFLDSTDPNGVPA